MRTINNYFETTSALHECPLTVKLLFEKINTRLLMLRLENPRKYRYTIAGFRGKMVPIPCHYVHGSLRRLQKVMSFSPDEMILMKSYSSSVCQYFKHHEKHAVLDTSELEELYDGLTTVQICNRAGIAIKRNDTSLISEELL